MIRGLYLGKDGSLPKPFLQGRNSLDETILVVKQGEKECRSLP